METKVKMELERQCKHSMRYRADIDTQTTFIVYVPKSMLEDAGLLGENSITITISK